MANTVWKMVNLFYFQSIDLKNWSRMVQTIIYLYALITGCFFPLLQPCFRTKGEQTPRHCYWCVEYLMTIKCINQRHIFFVYQKNTHLKPSRHHQKTSEMLLFRREHLKWSFPISPQSRVIAVLEQDTCAFVAESWKFPRTETPQSHEDPILVLHNTLRYFFFSDIQSVSPKL